MRNFLILGVIFGFIFQMLWVNGLVEITNIKCIPIDKAFSDFEYCYIKAVNRSYKYISLKVKLFQVPINNVTVRVQSLRKGNGYRPDLYDFTVDACKFMRQRKNIVVNYFYSFFEKHSNMNHTCPYNHDLIVDKIDVNFMNNQMTKVLPMPEGEYALYGTWSAYNVPRAIFKIFYRLRNYRV